LGYQKGCEVPTQLTEGEDYYVENGRWVFTAKFLLDRGYCCGSGCRHCPYAADEEPDDRGEPGA
jgi:hypothetical protein